MTFSFFVPSESWDLAILCMPQGISKKIQFPTVSLTIPQRIGKVKRDSRARRDAGPGNSESFRVTLGPGPGDRDRDCRASDSESRTTL